ncbi:MAG TPA: hypothetical protein VGX46_20205 [Vicinamibacterales bacterium]|jgi:hypothetical protein|nr:hypothetical protein [Vicinamibacterales bacterium]
MNAPEREQDARTNGSQQPTFRLLTRDALPPPEVKPVPEEDEQPADEPGYGHGV